MGSASFQFWAGRSYHSLCGPLACADAADMGRVKVKGPAQHIVLRSGGFHQKIQLISDNLFHEARPFLRTQRETETSSSVKNVCNGICTKCNTKPANKEEETTLQRRDDHFSKIKQKMV